MVPEKDYGGPVVMVKVIVMHIQLMELIGLERDLVHLLDLVLHMEKIIYQMDYGLQVVILMWSLVPIQWHIQLMEPYGQVCRKIHLLTSAVRLLMAKAI